MYLNLKFRCFVTSFALVLTTSSLSAGECVVHNPVIPTPINPPAISSQAGLFSDVLAAPNGAPLTVYGTNLSGPLVVGGVAMSNCPIVNETVFEESLGSIRLAKTTCWLEDVPLGETYIQSGSSEILPLHIIEGNVQTLSSFGEFHDAMQDPEPGDFFILKGFTADLTADGHINGGSMLLYMRTGEHDASPLNPIALIGYPGDPAKVVVDELAYDGKGKGLYLKNTGWTISNLDFQTVHNAIHLGGEFRLTGNRISGITGAVRPSGTGSVTAGGFSKGGFIAGNVVSGGRSDWRLDHAIYITDCPTEKGWTVEWNHVVDNDFSRGPQVMINHQWPRCGKETENVAVASHAIRNNVVDTSKNRGTCIGVSSFGWLPEYTSKQPGIAYIENNFLVNCGNFTDDVDEHGDGRKGAAMWNSRGNTVTRGNIFYRSHWGMMVGTPATNSVTHPVDDFLPDLVTDNIFIDNQGHEIITLLNNNIKPLSTIENNEFK